MTVKAEKLNVFIDSVIGFFAQIGERSVEVDTPYLNSNAKPMHYDYTGIITITGPLRGCVYVSTTPAMLRNLLEVINEPDTSVELMRDLVGEIANTVSGNARSEFGPEFIISPPKIIDGVPDESFLPPEERTYVIPFSWQSHTGVIGIYIN